MSYRSMLFVNSRMPVSLRGSVLAILLLALAGCVGGPSPREAEPERVIELPPIPDIVIPEPAYTDFAAAINYLQRGQSDAAESALRQMIRQYPQISGPYTNLAGLLANQGKNEEALELIRQAVERNPRSAPAYNLQGLLERKAGNFELAERAYRNALMADDQFTDAQRNLGILYDLYLRRPKAALAAYQAYQSMLEEPDQTVALWIADLERRTR